MAPTNLPESEFTGKTRELYTIRISLSVQRQAEHKTEGWIKMPGVEPAELTSVPEQYLDRALAESLYMKLRAALLA